MRRERGFSLIEMMVASAIFAIAAAIAFILYSAAQKSYKAGENFTDQQQSTRVAFDRMVSDIRLAGFNTNPDGDASRIDEQIEGAWDTAITIRGDFDFEDPTASTTPESALPGTQYNVVSTGNDEIVSYVLAKPGPTGPTHLDFRVDAAKPRTKTLADIQIPNVALVQDNPPYTLYRVTLTDVAGNFPTSPQASSAFVYEPVAENIRTMTLLYYDDAGTLLNPNTPANAADDIGGGDANNTLRARIRRVAVSIVGMTQDEDLDYTDPTDATATSHFRKFDLSTDVNPENLGKSGVKDIDITAPPAPTNVSVVPGHCQGLLVKWDQPSPTSGVTSYVIKYYPSGSPTNFQTRAFTYPHLDYGTLDYLGHGFLTGLTMGANTCVQVQARDLAGNQSAWAPTSGAPCGVVSNTNTPGTPQTLTASYYATSSGMPASLDSKIQLSWDELKVNTIATNIAGDPNAIGGATILRDLQGYKVYRDSTSSFLAPIVVKTPTDVPVGTQAVQDAAPACRDFYYKVAAVDLCGVESAQSAMATGRANTLFVPAAPTGVTAIRTGQNTIRVQWTGVTTNTASPAGPITVDQYKIYRAVGATTLSPTDPSLSYSLITTATPSTTPPTYDDPLNATVKNQLRTQAAFYKVSALDYCPNESAGSDGAKATCPFSASSIQALPVSGSSGGGDVTISLAVIGGTDPSYTGTVHIARNSDGYGPSDIIFPSLSSSPSTATWLQTSGDTGVYTITFTVENDRGCISTTTAQYTRTTNLPCKLAASTPATLTPATGSLKTNKLGYTLTNTYSKPLDINKVTLSWTNPGTRKVSSVEMPTGSSMCTPASLSPAVCTPLFLAPQIAAGGSNGTLNIWDTSVATETFTIKYDFTDSTGMTGSCTVCVSSTLATTISTTGTCP